MVQLSEVLAEEIMEKDVLALSTLTPPRTGHRFPPPLGPGRGQYRVCMDPRSVMARRAVSRHVLCRRWFSVGRLSAPGHPSGSDAPEI